MMTTDQIVDLLTSLNNPERTYLYGPRPIPHEIDDEVRAVVRHLMDANLDERDLLLSVMTERHGRVLTAFAERMANLAVRTRDVEFVREGLAALAFASHYVGCLDAVSILSLLYHSLVKLGLEPAGFFAEVAGLGEKRFDWQLRDFPDREEEERCIAQMDFIEGSDDDGFRYIYNPPMFVKKGAGAEGEGAEGDIPIPTGELRGMGKFGS